MSERDSDVPTELTIDELAAASRVPSRTIRYYQSAGALARPKIRGRVAYYNAGHLERLKQVAVLKDRGLRMKAISELLRRVDRGEVDLRDWLGLESQITTPWLDDTSGSMSEEELLDFVQGGRAGLLSDLERLGLVERNARGFSVRSLGLLKLTVELEASGIDLDTAYEGAATMRKYAARAAQELSSQFFKRAAKGFGHDAQAGEVVDAVRAVRPLAQEAFRLIFGQEMEKVLRELSSSGAKGIIGKKRRPKTKRG